MATTSKDMKRVAEEVKAGGKKKRVKEATFSKPIVHEVKKAKYTDQDLDFVTVSNGRVIVAEKPIFKLPSDHFAVVPGLDFIVAKEKDHKESLFFLFPT